jgi:hypothetical protein
MAAIHRELVDSGLVVDVRGMAAAPESDLKAIAGYKRQDKSERAPSDKQSALANSTHCIWKPAPISVPG